MAMQDRPCIHVCCIGSADEDLYRWVEIGAEEEGVPTRRMAAEADEPVAAAYAMAQSSRFEIGVSVAPGKVVLHERHMPPAQPVLSFAIGTDPRPMCRLMGSNAARMVVRLPFRFDIPDETQAPAQLPAQYPGNSEVSGELAGEFVRMVATIIARILKERGVV
jgi:hypothetical protein